MMANNNDRAKLPQVFHTLLPRRKIAEIIDHAPLSEVIYMVAPYGFGKTLAALSWLQERSRKAAWITLEETDDAESAFLELVAAAFAPFTVNQYDRTFLLNNETDVNLKAFSPDIASCITEGRIQADTLVIDNFHFIKNAGLLRDIKDFLQTLLGRLRIIVVSRAELSPVFNDLVLKRHICLITTKELSFNAEEISEYFDSNRQPACQQELAWIQRDTEGWPAAINVILMTSRDGSIDYGENARVYIKGFFENDIWNSLDDNIKDFLLRTAVLDQLNPTACHALTGIGATLPILEWLFTNGLFITRRQRDTYEYHRVFKDYLLDKLESSDIDDRLLNQKYAWWLFERNEFERSFPLFFKAHDLYGINRVLKSLNPETMNGMERFLEVLGCLTTLEIDDLKKYPVIVARIALIEYLTGNIDRFHMLYHTLLEWMDPGILQVSSEIYAEYVWEVGWLCYLDPDEGENGGIHARQIEWCNYSNYVPHLRELHLSRAAVLRFPSVLRGVRDYSGILQIFQSAYKSNMSEESRIIHEEDALMEMDLILAEYLYETEKFAESEEIVRRVMTHVEERRYTDFYFICTALLVKLMRATQNTKEVDALILRLESMIMHNRDYFLLPNFRAFKFRNSLADGHTEFDAVFENENRKYKDKSYYYLRYRLITFARGLISTGDYNETILILNNLALVCQKYKRIMDMIEINILKSISMYGMGGHEEAAFRHMEAALREARKYGYIRIFSDDAKTLWPILQVAHKRMTGVYIQKVLLSCKKELMRSGQDTSEKRIKHADLTKTEIRILKSLQMGMSYKDIEIENNIQGSTVKSHVHSIYSKLNVNNRTAAIIEAQKRGILFSGNDKK